MKLFNLVRRSSFTRGLTQVDSKAWWIEISTIEPPCRYYFGPFKNPVDAIFNCLGYVTDLANEKAKGITVTFKHCNPKRLTVCDGEES
ncbi:MAG: DUF1816 domain-containing protein [Cyanobacteria bacterium RM1_2_2]|nr:DUF1816 domain-containing protein [Cyanobacteria bacterium RM1_2_2]